MNKKSDQKMDPFWGLKKSPKIADFVDEVERAKNEERSDEVFVIFVTMRSRALRVEAQRQLLLGIAERHLECPAGIREVLEPSAQHYF